MTAISKATDAKKHRNLQPRIEAEDFRECRSRCFPKHSFDEILEWVSREANIKHRCGIVEGALQCGSGRCEELEGVRQLKFLHQDAMNLAIVEIDMPFEGIQDRLHNVIQVPLHRIRREIENGDGERHFGSEVTSRQYGAACLDDSRFPP